MQESQNLQEYVHAPDRPMQVDRRKGVIRGVKVLGLTSRNGRCYPPETLLEAGGLYEGAKVNVNHPKGDPNSPRDYQDRLGYIRNVRFEQNSGLFADLHFNPRHTLAEQLLWDAEHSPRNVGFSHNVRAVTEQLDGKVVVRKIVCVNSVDLVADPATTSGLFESQAPGASPEIQEEINTLRAQLAEMKAVMEKIMTSFAESRTHALPQSREQHHRDGEISNTGDFVRSILR